LSAAVDCSGWFSPDDEVVHRRSVVVPTQGCPVRCGDTGRLDCCLVVGKSLSSNWHRRRPSPSTDDEILATRNCQFL
jgi:hypothetical protein